MTTKLAALLQEKPKVVSFHFGVLAAERVRMLRYRKLNRHSTDAQPLGSARGAL